MAKADWTRNAQGLWCDVCGEHIADNADLETRDFHIPDNCPGCGWRNDKGDPQITQTDNDSKFPF